MVDLQLACRLDDPTGIWYKCLGCKKELFLPDFDRKDIETETLNYCPYCGEKINKIIQENG
jgi:DNA-directed RNA polymerase subunit RPC12/RpoP